MGNSVRIGILLIIVLLAWVIIYYRLVAPALKQPEPPPGLTLQTGDTVSTQPETEEQAGATDAAGSVETGDDRAGTDSAERTANRDSSGGDQESSPVNGTRPASDAHDSSNGDGTAENAGSSGDDDGEPRVVLPKPPATTPYLVKSGDTMESIAEDWFGSKQKWVLIAQENPLADPAKMKAGITLRLPPKDARLETIPTDVYEEMTRKIRYVISSGDTLSAIARRFYGRPTLWREVYNANKDVIRDPDVLDAGVEIVIPRIQQPAD